MGTTGTGSVKEPGCYRELLLRDPLQDSYKCPVCKFLLKEPMQTLCGHRVCATCILTLEVPGSTEELKCPECHEVVSKENVFNDNAALREILNLWCYCSGKTRGCHWEGEIRALQEHETHCEYQLIPCSNRGCEKKLLRKNHVTHVYENCAFRNVACEYCKFKTIQHLLEEHYRICKDYPVMCNLNCGKKDIPRQLLINHLAEECQNAEIKCSFFTSGCNFKGPKKKVERHMIEMMNRHADMATNAIYKEKERSEGFQKRIVELKGIVRDRDNTIKSQEATINEGKKESALTEKRIEALEAAVNVKEQQIKDLAAKLDSMQKRKSKSR